MANDKAAIIAREYNVLRKHVNAVIKLLEDGATIPFIARYRKEATNSMDEVMIENIRQRSKYFDELAERKEHIISVIKEQKALTPELAERIADTLDATLLEDIYMPFKPRRRTRATMARENGLEPLARMIMAQNNDDPGRSASKFLSEAVPTIDDAVDGAADIIAEWVSESEKARNLVRSRFNRSAVISSKVIKGKEEDGRNYQNYFDFSTPLRTCSSHRYLAMRRGEEEKILKVEISIDDDEMIDRLCRMFVRSTATPACADIVRRAVKDGYRRLLRPSIENEVASAVKDKSDAAAIAIFADNLRQLLMSPPLGRKRVLAIDPGFRTGCKVVCLDEHGALLCHEIIYPCAPHNDFYGSADVICGMVEQFSIGAIAIGNGTAGRETERFINQLVLPRKCEVFMVNEDGASVYSASEAARSEFPDEDVTVRGTVSIGRRLIDPLAELVKIDPKSIGVGQYQHDVNQSKLKEALDYTVSSCVNAVGVNVNTASRELLSYVSGIGPALASNIVEYRDANGGFTARQQLLAVSRMGEKAFQQSAGFLRIPGAESPLDNTGVHPERYGLVETIAADLGVSVDSMVGNKRLLASIDLERYVSKEVGMPTLNDIVAELEKPGRDPREQAEAVEFDENVRTIDDLHIGQELNGKVNNLTSFGVFVDIGLKENGLVHISQLTDRFITNAADVVSVGQPVKVRVIDVDVPRRRIALTMKNVPQ